MARFSEWLTISQITAKIGFIATVSTNLIFIIFTLFMIHRKFGFYKYIMLSFSMTGIVYSCLDIIVWPTIHSYNAGYIIFSLSDFSVIFICVYAGFFVVTVCFLAIQFLYRYFSVFHIEKLKYLTNFNYIFWLLYVFLCFSIVATSCYFSTEIDEFSTEYMRAEVYDCYGLDISKIAALIMVAYDSEGIRWRNMSYVIICTAVLSVQYFIIVFCGFRLHKEMNTKIFHFSPSYRKLHQQCFKALVIQVTAPTIVMFIPVCLILYLPLLNINFSLPTAALYCSITIYPALDAIIVMYNISDYRNKFTIGIKKLAGAIPLSSIGSID